MKRIAALALLLAGCGAGTSSQSNAPNAALVRTTPLTRSLKLSSTAFANGKAIPQTYTCDGIGLSLPVRWSGVPRGTREMLLVMRDRDADGGNFVHWSVAGIAPHSGSIAAGNAPAGAVLGRNSFGTVGYRGPCPPAGAKAHHYVLTLTALAGPSDVKRGFSVDDAIRSAVLAIATLDGTYGRR
jgi:Raf kinase inhibitor-like YbhB/YbcL family protein